MKSEFTVAEKIQINAPVAKVWDVLTNPEFIRQWDDVPASYGGGNLLLNSVLEWEGYSKLTVTVFEINKLLKLSMFLPKVALDASKYNVGYTYGLAGNGNSTVLSIEIGDFAPLPNAKDYVDSSLEFLKTGALKIKVLAEGD